MGEFWKIVAAAAVAFIFGAGGLEIIGIFRERAKFKADRKAKKEDRAEEKEDKLTEISKKLDAFIDRQEKFNEASAAQDKEMQDQLNATADGMKFVLLDRILYLGQSYIKNGEVSFDDRKRLGDMHTVYHGSLHGNGDADKVMDGVYELPLKP